MLVLVELEELVLLVVLVQLVVHLLLDQELHLTL
jgi:hypothetical protein